MARGIVIGIVLTIVVLLGGAYVVLRSGLIPANADATPGALENFARGRRFARR